MDFLGFVKNMIMRKNELLEVTFQLALKIIEYSEILEKHKKYVIAKQVLRSGTSVGANCRESQGAESRADFIHKLKISYKEAVETNYWLELCKFSKNYPDPDEEVRQLLNSSIRLLGKILSSAKKAKMVG